MTNQTWYQATGSKKAELWTILHIPYTLMCISFLLVGFGLAGVQRWDVLGWIVVAYFLGLGLAAHSFDQLPGMGSCYVKYLNQKDLVRIGTIALAGALLIGVYWMLKLSAWHLLWLIPLQTFFVWAYPISKFARGFFHTDFWFAVSFGFIPVMAGYYINTLTFVPTTWVPWAVAALIISLIEINLSRYSREMRQYTYHTGNNKAVILTKNLGMYPIDVINRPERALKLLCLLTYLIAITIIVNPGGL